MFTFSLLLPLFLAPLLASQAPLKPSARPSLLVPLYIYPGVNHVAWKPLLDSIKANPQIFYNVIVNPDSGPGAGHYPDKSLVEAISTLNAIKNVRTVGYVDTSYTKRDITLVNKDIDTYANWASYKDANITVHGIFFDDVSSADSQSVYHYYERLGDYTRTHDNNIPYVIFNPGTIAPAQLFSYCDTMVEFESPYNTYQKTFTFNNLPPSSKLRRQSAVIINNLPTSADVQGLVHKMASEGIGMLYATSDCCYQQLNGGILKLLTQAITGS